METQGFVADVVTYNSLLEGCSREGKRTELAEELLRAMEEKSDESYNFKDNAHR
jgi:pentatricopeptide repeat protein